MPPHDLRGQPRPTTMPRRREIVASLPYSCSRNGLAAAGGGIARTAVYTQNLQACAPPASARLQVRRPHCWHCVAPVGSKSVSQAMPSRALQHL
mmetsp:Transcript_63945/g.193030  ORF Transcript_63945/g.193030 Transcript_63945/m.193030 type:complete len:94 (-) Transcript_63945:127-408(-)